MEIKTCRACGESKPLEQFYRNHRSPDGRLHRCKECQNAAVKRYRQTPQGKACQNRSNAITRGANTIHAYREIKGLMKKAADEFLAELGLKPK